jgi:hypothetical protein
MRIERGNVVESRPRMIKGFLIFKAVMRTDMDHERKEDEDEDEDKRERERERERER